MTKFRRNMITALAAVLLLGSLEAGAQFALGEGGYISSAEAIVGRPLTPVSVAGVARRTVRRCAVGVYYC